MRIYALRFTKDLLRKFQLFLHEQKKLFRLYDPLCFGYLFGGGFHASSGTEDKDKRNFIRQMVQDFQEYEDITDFKPSVFELRKETKHLGGV